MRKSEAIEATLHTGQSFVGDGPASKLGTPPSSDSSMTTWVVNFDSEIVFFGNAFGVVPLESNNMFSSKESCLSVFVLFFGRILQCLLRNLNNAVFRADGELVDTSSTQAGVTSGTSDSDNPRIPTMQAHVAGTCRPCVFHPTTRGCPKGDLCAYCHINHPRTMMERRVRKRTRDKIKRKLLEILNPPVDLETWRPFLDDFFFWSESDSGFFHSFLELC